MKRAAWHNQQKNRVPAQALVWLAPSALDNKLSLKRTQYLLDRRYGKVAILGIRRVGQDLRSMVFRARFSA
jgi:hypothetical protein